MTIQIERTVSPNPYPNVFEAGLPSIDYLTARGPEEAHAIISAAPGEQAPIALGPHGPEVLTYELVRAGAARPPVSHAARVHPGGTGHHVGTGVGPVR